MAEFKRSYDETETMEGDYSMTEGTGLGTGFVGGLIVGGLAGWAFSRDRNNYGYGYPMPPVVNNEGTYSIADVSGLIATKDAQYAQLNATQTSEFNVLSQLYKDNTTLASAICDLGYENARLASNTQLEISQASAKNDLHCCQTQGLINQKTAETQGAIAQIVPQMQNFYLADEVEKLRIKSVKAENAYQFGSLTAQLGIVGKAVEAVYDKVNTSSTTTTT